MFHERQERYIVIQYERKGFVEKDESYSLSCRNVFFPSENARFLAAGFYEGKGKLFTATLEVF